MSMKKRMILCLLACLLLATSCGDTTAETETTSTENHAETTMDTESTYDLGIPEEDNAGRDFHILVPTEKAYEFAEEATGEVVNDAIYERSLATMEHFNIAFSYQQESGDWEVRNTYNNFISNAVIAGDSTYDLTTGYIVCTLPIFVSGNFIDLTTMTDLHLDNPWWMANQYDNLNIKGKQFCCFGDANLSVYKDCAVVYFNKQVLSNFGLEDPYTLVRENEWTMEKFLSMSETAVVDLNGDGKIDPKVDAVGAYLQHVPLRAIQTATDTRMFTIDENGDYHVTDLNDKMLQVHEWIQLFGKRDDLYKEGNAVDFQAFAEMFASDRALFQLSYLYVLEGDIMRNMESDFGLVPYPKYDSEQELYKTQIGTSSNVNFLPLTCADPDLTCRVLETLAYHSMLDVVPTYYTVALESKYTRDNDVQEMLQIIREGMTMNFDFAFSTCLSPMPNTALLDAGDNLSSYLAKNRDSWNTQIEKLCENLD